MLVRLNRPVSDVLLSNALRAVLLKYPVHCMTFFRKEPLETLALLREEDRKLNGKNYEARLVSEILYKDVVSHQQLTSVDASYLTRLSKHKLPIDVDEPTWHITVNNVGTDNTQYLTFASNHVFIDGNSGVHFLDDLVRELASAERHGDLQMVETLYRSADDAPETLPPPAEKVVDLFNYSWWFAVKTVVKVLLLPKSLVKFVSSYLVPGSPNLYKHPIFNYHPISHDNESNFRRVSLTPPETAAALAFCKQNGVTLTPFIAACAMKALDETISAKLHLEPSYDFGLIICGRRYYPEKKDQTRYGLFMSNAKPVLSRNISLIQATKTLSAKLAAAVKNRRSFSLIALLQIINIWDMFQKQYDHKDTRTTVEVSNVGLVKIQHGDWSVEDMIFSQGAGGTHFTLSTCSTAAGGLNVTVAYHESLDEVENGIEEFVSLLKQKLLLE